MLWMVFYVAIYAAVYFFAIDKVYGLLQMAAELFFKIKQRMKEKQEEKKQNQAGKQERKLIPHGGETEEKV